MQLAIPFGENGSAACDIDQRQLVAEVQPGQLPLEDLAGAVHQALGSPLGFPPLEEATVPGDLIAFPFAGDVPQIPELVSGIVQFFAAAGLADRSLLFLLPAGTPESLVEAVQGAAAPFEIPVEVKVHDPGDQRANAFLTSNAEDRAIFLNRQLCEADVVIPVGMARPRDQADYFGPFTTVFPLYGDEDCQRRWSAPGFIIRPGQRKKRQIETQEVGDLLGILCGIQLLPATGGGVSRVLFGMVPEVTREADRLLDAAWRHSADQTCQVVLALVSGNRGQQTWANAARALAAAERVVQPGGAIVLCTEIHQPPDQALALLARPESPDELCQSLRKCRLPNAWVAMQMASSLRHHKIYLRSLLPESVLDDMDLIPVASDEECQRICAHYGSTIVLHDAQSISVAPQPVESE